MEKIDSTRTPCFVLDLHKVRKNVEKMSNYAHEESISLVPHMKTHKTKELGKLMTEKNNGRRHVVVSSLSEATFFATSEDPKFEEITYAYPLTADKLDDCSKLNTDLKQFNLLIDNNFILKHLSDNPPLGEKLWNVYVDIDLLYQRSGLMANQDSTFEFIKKVASTPYVNFVGLYMHCGSSYSSRSTEETKLIVTQSVSSLNELSSKLKESGIQCERIAIGSTPSCSLFIDGLFKGVTEIHPGNYVFYDAQQECLHSCKEDDIAGTVLTRVIAMYPERNMLLIDCGWEGLSSEKPGDEQYWKKYGYAKFRNFPQLKLLSMSQVSCYDRNTRCF